MRKNLLKSMKNYLINYYIELVVWDLVQHMPILLTDCLGNKETWLNFHENFHCNSKLKYEYQC